jgi:large subunit ribosomal protein L5
MRIGLKKLYKEQVRPFMKDKFTYSNLEQLPKIRKISVNRGIGGTLKNTKALTSNLEEISLIVGQKPKINKATKSVAGFKIREGMIVGLSATLRKDKMYAFLEKLIHIVFPRVRDFRGLDRSGFDKRGNYNIGIDDQEAFPEVTYEGVASVNGLGLSIVTTAKTDEEALTLLGKMGFPFIDKNDSL